MAVAEETEDGPVSVSARIVSLGAGIVRFSPGTLGNIRARERLESKCKHSDFNQEWESSAA